MRILLLLLLLPLVAVAFVGCQSGGESRSGAKLTGSVTYRERMALPPGSKVTVRFEDISRADDQAEVLGEQTLDTDGAQVPFPFELHYDNSKIIEDHRYNVRAEIRSPDGALMFATTEPHGVLAEGLPNTEPIQITVHRMGGDPSVGDASRQAGKTLVYDCAGDLSFIVRTGPGETAVWIPKKLGGGYAVLSQTPAASGARYAEEDTVYWSQGELATFEVDGETFADCRPNPAKAPWADAKRRGVNLRALGNEPSWSLEISDQQLVMVTDLGASTTVMPYVRPETDGSRTTYRASSGGTEMTIVMEGRDCVDTMSGEAFALTVSVTLEGEEFHGCGRPL